MTLACKEVQGSLGLLRLLEVVLSIGNCLNSSRGITPAKGFNFDMLTELKDIKCHKPDGPLPKWLPSSLLEYLVDIISKRSPVSLRIPEELAHVKSASTSILFSYSCLLLRLLGSRWQGSGGNQTAIEKARSQKADCGCCR